MDTPTVCLFCGILLLLAAATLGMRSLRKYTDFGVDPAIIDTFRARLRIWWILFGLLASVFFTGPIVTVLFFFFLSVTILREYITLTPKSPADHQTLFGIYLFFTPLQFALVGINPDWFVNMTGFTPYHVFSLLMPACVFLVLPGLMAISGDPKRFLERTAKLQLGLIICVYSLSYAPALLTLNLPGTALTFNNSESTLLDRGLEGTVIAAMAYPDGAAAEYLPASFGSRSSVNPPLFRVFPLMSGKHFQLLLFFIIVVQLGDVFQYLWSHASRRHIVANSINLSRTWEGFCGGVLTTTLLGVALWYFTPFPQWWQAGVAAAAAAVLGFLGSMTMSAIKRDRGVGSYGALIPGHSGFLDRIDSLCFAAPVFYHFTWYFAGST
ncbi:MAG: phosphatidate cytidylyltransferase [Planctomycetaceae bacterium]|jgi:phosphatidate cytidylyltransferase|nr:phosphatidate cytidylyltransferase [Planctomycetaceae bacterium]